tara:strand:+ start:179 stop:454 length:276 start_codon:yes stop_codon:yes gene_type:complete
MSRSWFDVAVPTEHHEVRQGAFGHGLGELGGAWVAHPRWTGATPQAEATELREWVLPHSSAKHPEKPRRQLLHALVNAAILDLEQQRAQRA